MTNHFPAVTVAISTYGTRVDNAILIAKSFLSLGFPIILIHQSHSPILLQDMCINYIHTNSKGVTISRNIAIDNCHTKYIWFMDDDIKLLNINMDEFHMMFTSCEVVKTIRVLNENFLPRKIYPKTNSYLNKRSIIAVGTIEIIADVTFLKSFNIYFPSDMGAGSNNPVGDEAVFLSAIIDNGGKIKHYAMNALMHPDDSSGKVLNPVMLRSKGLMIRRLFGAKYFIIIFYLSLKLKTKEINFFSSLFYLFKGFLYKNN